MSLFDAGGEISLKFRFRKIEAARGEEARDEIEKKIREFFGPDASIRFERLWFEPSTD